MNYVQYTEIIFGISVFQKLSTNISEMYTYDVIGKALDIIRKYEKQLSIYENESEISKINNSKTNEFVKVSDETFDIIAKALQYCSVTNGLFDITISPLVNEWNIRSLNNEVPDNETLEKLVDLVDYKNIELNFKEKSIRLKKADMKIDLVGIVKGYVSDKIIKFYEEHKIESAMINLGGNIKILGNKESDISWNIGISVPEEDNNMDIACILAVKDKNSIITLGGYENKFTSDGKMSHPILNPNNGHAAETDIKSITLVGEDSAECNCLSIPLFVMGKEKSIEFMKKYNISGLIIGDDNEIIVSRNLVKDLRLVGDYNVLCF